MATHSIMSSQGIIQWKCRGISRKVGELRQCLRYGKLHISNAEPGPSVVAAGPRQEQSPLINIVNIHNFKLAPGIKQNMRKQKIEDNLTAGQDLDKGDTSDDAAVEGASKQQKLPELDATLWGQENSKMEERRDDAPTKGRDSIVLRALSEPDLLAPKEVDGLVRIVLRKATHDNDLVEPAAKFCTRLIMIFGVLLLAQAGGEVPALLSGYDGAPLPSHQAHHVRIAHLESTLDDLPGNRPATVTSCADADRHNVKTALLADWSGIKTGHPLTQAIGHGGTARMQDATLQPVCLSTAGMHTFPTRLAGVAKIRVTGQPRDDGHAQLDELNEHSSALVIRYLQLDDVAWHCQSLTNVL
ncbi:hypothetical protein HPB51_029491 [Rhipicephalus microplus]|uniref:Uncharacterized protein n=1 Tax=Rhipicephalus microplus TaxID=6941 RepID=A0A9J6CUR6_RHIMP|nr:hypothetical protein HPB51_029491 [Rhipicephalus microplus]